jgi:hypothetical protein
MGFSRECKHERLAPQARSSGVPRVNKLVHAAECYDLAKDPQEIVYNYPDAQKTVVALKWELFRLERELKDDDQFVDGSGRGLNQMSRHLL